jgi:mono/diheme cytochrome c family protein
MGGGCDRAEIDGSDDRSSNYDSVKTSLFAMMLIRPLAATTICAFLMACSGAASVETPVVESKPAVIEPAAASPTPVAGQAAYLANCARCHGEHGEGSPKGIPMTSGHAIAHSADDYIAQIENGQRGKMPAFKDKLSNGEITAIVTYVRDVLQADITPEMRAMQHHH